MQTQFDLAQAVTVPRYDEEGAVASRLPGTVVGISITASLGERYRVEFVDESGYLQTLEYDAAQLVAA